MILQSALSDTLMQFVYGPQTHFTFLFVNVIYLYFNLVGRRAILAKVVYIIYNCNCPF